MRFTGQEVHVGTDFILLSETFRASLCPSSLFFSCFLLATSFVANRNADSLKNPVIGLTSLQLFLLFCPPLLRFVELLSGQR